MSKLCVVPVDYLLDNHCPQCGMFHLAPISNRPPLPADIEAAVEVARVRVMWREERKQLDPSDYLGAIGSNLDLIDRALLKACGRE